MSRLTNDLVQKRVKQFMVGLRRRNPSQKIFHQAVEEFILTVMPFTLAHDKYRENYILEKF